MHLAVHLGIRDLALLGVHCYGFHFLHLLTCARSGIGLVHGVGRLGHDGRRDEVEGPRALRLLGQRHLHVSLLYIGWRGLAHLLQLPHAHELRERRRVPVRCQLYPTCSDEHPHRHLCGEGHNAGDSGSHGADHAETAGGRRAGAGLARILGRFGPRPLWHDHPRRVQRDRSEPNNESHVEGDGAGHQGRPHVLRHGVEVR
mmetsp:Transcript_53156/g.149214  ORF Transcript_53156/g.149214 Transcript_53156/m.149214 type:complete len:201 (-) Transcript_53156:354-956(-)